MIEPWEIHTAFTRWRAFHGMTHGAEKTFRDFLDFLDEEVTSFVIRDLSLIKEETVKKIQILTGPHWRSMLKAHYILKEDKNEPR
jgi:hypothetical protein